MTRRPTREINSPPENRIALTRQQLATTSDGTAALPCTDWSYAIAFLALALIASVALIVIAHIGGCA
jgi:hypothetical protein